MLRKSLPKICSMVDRTATERLTALNSRVQLPRGRTVTSMAEADKRDPDERDLAGQDPEEVLRRMLKISPEDAAEVREQASEKAAPKD